jgi:hypothetical protein
MDDDDLQQADLSHLRLTEMTVEQKTEMRRRYVDFVRRLAKPPTAKRKVATLSKWMPGRKSG